MLNINKSVRYQSWSTMFCGIMTHSIFILLQFCQMKTIARIICITALLLTFTSAEAKKCRALALSGGGDKGAYEAAVFHGLYENLPAEELQYDVITGVSAGSLNTLALSTFDPTDVHSAASYMLFYWRNILTFPDPTTTWDILYGLMFKQGMFTLDN